MGQGSLRGGTRGNGGEQGEPEGQGGVTVPGSVGLGARPFPPQLFHAGRGRASRSRSRHSRGTEQRVKAAPPLGSSGPGPVPTPAEPHHLLYMGTGLL